MGGGGPEGPCGPPDLAFGCCRSVRTPGHAACPGCALDAIPTTPARAVRQPPHLFTSPAFLPPLSPSPHPPLPTMRLTAALLPALLPLASAFILPGPGDAFALASDLLGQNETPDTVLSPASDVTLQSIGSEDFFVITSADHPVSRALGECTRTAEDRRAQHPADRRTTRSASSRPTAGATPTCARGRATWT